MQHFNISLSKRTSVCSVGNRECSSTHLCNEFEHTFSNISVESQASNFKQTDSSFFSENDESLKIWE